MMELSDIASTTNTPVKRMVVLVSDFHALDEFALGGKVRTLAHPSKAAVLYLAVINNLDDEMPALHRLTRLAAVTRDAWVRVELQVALDHSWSNVIRRLYQPGDLLVCFEGHQVPSGLFGHKSIVSELSDHLHLPVWVLKNGQPPAG